MNTYIKYEHPTHEIDELKRDKMMFNTPYQVLFMEGADHSPEADLSSVAILSSN